MNKIKDEKKNKKYLKAKKEVKEAATSRRNTLSFLTYSCSSFFPFHSLIFY